ncbi:MAG: hypothetical protein KBT27_06085 [Prevotellaceae bacterium]|nr:hypothetical protein [Candidatus Faecinaster equi]
MENSILLDNYLDLVRTIHGQVVGGKMNPAKPMVLYSILILIEDGKNHNNHALITDIVEQYVKLQNKYSVPTPPQYPIYFMENESYYHLKWKNGRIKTHTPSAKLIRENVEYAYLDNALWDLLQDKETRDLFRQTIENYYLKI